MNDRNFLIGPAARPGSTSISLGPSYSCAVGSNFGNDRVGPPGGPGAVRHFPRNFPGE